MAKQKRLFRNAWGGFRKKDVVAYIEKTSAEHRAELLEKEQTITALQEANHSLQQQLNILMMSTPAPAPAPAPAPEPAPAPAAPSQDMMMQELKAYRRAEAVERTANTRARHLYRKMEDLCDGAMGDFQAADSAVKQTIQVMMEQAANLEQAYQTLSDALNTSRDKLYTINEQFFILEEEDE